MVNDPNQQVQGTCLCSEIREQNYNVILNVQDYLLQKTVGQLALMFVYTVFVWGVT